MRGSRIYRRSSVIVIVVVGGLRVTTLFLMFYNSYRGGAATLLTRVVIGIFSWFGAQGFVNGEKKANGDDGASYGGGRDDDEIEGAGFAVRGSVR